MMKIDGSSLGERIKMLRQAKSLTQEELAVRAGLTKGFISQVERNLTSLSVESLIGILDALDEKPSTFFDGAFDEKIVFRLKDRVDMELEHVKMFQILVPAAQNRQMDPALLELDVGEQTPEEEPHEGEEFGFVLYGAVELTLGGKSYKIKKGECFYFKASKKHCLTNTRNNRAGVLWVSSPPNF
ncbi:MAG TPA: cupin domain-containing protein [Syntrophorhabdaceae bacterium]|jgi:transcriptional regulator with XRE-family HTH domain|nr:cupin domain-containing protein [Syntrophorhabdaceae bacterium]MDI9562460.1 cupin domain-containing protein [Pseudomonadota bacterium]MBP8698592.1 cupin domain-containing protein [Syntrophorhabdaceae bacterium]HOF57049.1 cupin domain-containing protein [Syntrophorhabdaceae bacterium]HOS04894.1 cupin domain-containing protein [Syntrophorhabdaceae bacterium]